MPSRHLLPICAAFGNNLFYYRCKHMFVTIVWGFLRRGGGAPVASAAAAAVVAVVSAAAAFLHGGAFRPPHNRDEWV